MYPPKVAKSRKVMANQCQQRSQPLAIPALLKDAGLRPRKSLGQNFLMDESALARVVEAAAIQPADTVLEIGAGLGSLTRHLAEQARKVVCVELDAALIPLLSDGLKDYKNVEIIQGDILALDPAKLINLPENEPAGGYIVAANIPYYITSALIRHLLESNRPPDRMVLTVQREVAERICAQPGSLNLLALSVQVYGKPKIVGRIPAGAFFPTPKVDSAIIRVDLYASPPISMGLMETFFRLAKAAFSQKRKTLRNALAGGMHWQPSEAEALLRKAGIDPMRRAETLNLSEWEELSKIVGSLSPEKEDQSCQSA